MENKPSLFLLADNSQGEGGLLPKNLLQSYKSHSLQALFFCTAKGGVSGTCSPAQHLCLVTRCSEGERARGYVGDEGTELHTAWHDDETGLALRRGVPPDI